MIPHRVGTFARLELVQHKVAPEAWARVRAPSHTELVANASRLVHTKQSAFWLALANPSKQKGGLGSCLECNADWDSYIYSNLLVIERVYKYCRIYNSYRDPFSPVMRNAQRLKGATQHHL